jgi:hypothetical protein
VLKNTILGFFTFTGAMKVFAREIFSVVGKVAVHSSVTIVCKKKFTQVLLKRLVVIGLTCEREPALLSREVLLLRTFLDTWGLCRFDF